MEDIREVLEMFESTQEFIDSLTNHKQTTTHGPFIIITKEDLLKHVYFCTYKTIPPKFEDTCKYPHRYTLSDVKYIFKLKEK